MKKQEIRPMLEALKKIRMPKIEDKGLRKTIITNHLYLLGQGKKYEEEIEKLRTVLLGPYDEELQEVRKLEEKAAVETDAKERKALIEEIGQHKELHEALSAFNKAAIEKGKEEVRVTLISAERFVEEYQKQDYDLGVVEALYPMFTEANQEAATGKKSAKKTEVM